MCSSGQLDAQVQLPSTSATAASATARYSKQQRCNSTNCNSTDRNFTNPVISLVSRWSEMGGSDRWMYVCKQMQLPVAPSNRGATSPTAIPPTATSLTATSPTTTPPTATPPTATHQRLPVRRLPTAPELSSLKWNRNEIMIITIL